jgi:drug/metabolite transporter (DMT)-like permease
MGALEPVTALLIGVFCFNETMTGKLFLGIAIILGAVTLVIMSNSDQK